MTIHAALKKNNCIAACRCLFLLIHILMPISAFAAGMNGYLAKPINVAELMRALADALA